jgi:tellurite resistance-related uncharacterized protein
MPDEKQAGPEQAQRRLIALSRWDSEGGAGIEGAQHSAAAPAESVPDTPDMTNAELVQLRVRVIALENLLISLLADASGRQLDLAREMVSYISPRPGFTQHHLTVQAAAHMVDLVQRSDRFREPSPSAKPYKTTPVFDEITLPEGLRREHRTKAGTWGIIRVLDGRLRYRVLDPSSETILEPGHPGLIRPDEPHLVEPLGRMRMQVEFYHEMPDL